MWAPSLPRSTVGRDPDSHPSPPMAGPRRQWCLDERARAPAQAFEFTPDAPSPAWSFASLRSGRARLSGFPGTQTHAVGRDRHRRDGGGRGHRRLDRAQRDPRPCRRRRHRGRRRQRPDRRRRRRRPDRRQRRRRHSPRQRRRRHPHRPGRQRQARRRDRRRYDLGGHGNDTSMAAPAPIRPARGPSRPYSFDAGAMATSSSLTISAPEGDGVDTLRTSSRFSRRDRPLHPRRQRYGGPRHRGRHGKHLCSGAGQATTSSSPAPATTQSPGGRGTGATSSTAAQAGPIPFSVDGNDERERGPSSSTAVRRR